MTEERKGAGTPWRVLQTNADEALSLARIRDEYNTLIVFGVQLETAQRIVTAVNAYEGMREALDPIGLKEMAAIIEQYGRKKEAVWLRAIAEKQAEALRLARDTATTEGGGE